MFPTKSFPNILGTCILTKLKSSMISTDLLVCSFADQEVRTKAVQWIEAINDDELADILPQFVQVRRIPH